MKPQSAGIVYRAEDGYRYERQHGSTSNLDILDTSPLPSSVKCHRCGEIGHKASNCKSGRSKMVPVSCQTSVEVKTIAMLTLQSNAVSSPQPQSLLRCYECEEFGHSVRFCPNF